MLWLDVDGALHRRDHLIDISDEEAGLTIVDQLAGGATGHADRRRAAGHRLHHREPERLIPLDRREQGGGARQQAGLGDPGHIGDVHDAIAVKRRSDAVLEVLEPDVVVSILPASTSRSPVLRATSMARCCPLSGQIRARQSR